MASSLSERERILLGYAPRDLSGSAPTANPNPIPNRKSSDVDFSDVFGGPPRRSSINELQLTRADSLDSGSWRGSGSGSGLGERPVFGEVSCPARRRHLKDDFFSDIFQSSDQSACSSPRRGDSFNSPTPGSRILSPTRPLPPVRGEAEGVGSLLAAQLSLSTKLAKATDHLMTSPTQRALYRNEDESIDTVMPSPTTFAPSCTIRAVTAQDDLKKDGNNLYHQSSRQVSHSLDKPLEVMDSTSVNTKSHPQKDSTSLENFIKKGQFHFSIYKWAGKGVTLIMPPKPNLQRDSRFKTLPEIVVQEVDLVLHGDNVRTLTTAGKSQNDNLKSVMDITVETQVDADSAAAKKPAESESKFHHCNGAEKSDIYNSSSKEVPVTIREAQKHELKNLKQLFDDDLEKQQKEVIIRHVEGTDDFSRGQQTVHTNVNIKQQAGRENKKNSVKVTSPDTRDAAVSPDEKVVGSKVKGKVKDFMKIFNQEVSPKHKGAFETPSRKSRGKDEGKGKVQETVFFSMPKADEQVKMTSESYNSILSDPPVQRKQDSEMAEKVKFDISFDVHMADDSLSERKDPLRPGADSSQDISSVYNIEESHCEDLEGFLVEPLSQDQNKYPKIDSDQVQIKGVDAKIREWSEGKEGNIRSLLSTLQYVLWPESGWKPIPLVDIIEGASVKRAYQKALLCLHPDKLQQKGAAPHHKYIAEKVFDIMQEAWDHFNSISQIY